MTPFPFSSFKTPSSPLPSPFFSSFPLSPSLFPYSWRSTITLSFLLLLFFLPFCPSSLASSPSQAALDALQKRIGYTFKSPGLLRRAVTHPSYSRDNYRPLGVLGLHAVRAVVSLRALAADPDASPGDLARRVADDTDGDACAADGLGLRLQALVRVAARTNASAPVVLCGAFRAVLGAVALDAGDVDACGDVFRRVHARGVGRGGAVSAAW
uniref:Ribonuclease 3 n=1 Tax=Anthurium amnicola TaxID=1678845 RepID=A0A1D1ZIU9_9ARAE